MGTIIFEIAGLLFLGALLYVADRTFGVGVKRWWRGMTSSKAGMVGFQQERGFIYGYRAKGRLLVVGTLVGLQFVVAVFFLRASVIPEVIWSIVSAVTMTIGTYFGRFTDKALGFADSALDRVEDFEKRIEAGETTLSREIRSGAQAVGAKARETFGAQATSGKLAQSSAPPPPQEDPAEKRRQQDDEGVKAFKKFTGKSGNPREDN